GNLSSSRGCGHGACPGSPRFAHPFDRFRHRAARGHHVVGWSAGIGGGSDCAVSDLGVGRGTGAMIPVPSNTRVWPKGPEAAYLGFCRNKCGTDHGSDRRRYMATLSAGNLKPRPSDTRSALTGYFGLLGLMATMPNSSSFDRKVRP